MDGGVASGGWADQMAAQIDAVFATNPWLPDHRREHPWLTGWLGDATSAVWFVAENASASQVDRIHTSDATVDAQWAASPADRLLREALVESGLKTGGMFTPGEWCCYLTNLMKSEVRVAAWETEERSAKLAVAKAWAPVFAFELEHHRPELLIVLGKSTTARYMKQLTREGLLPDLPRHVAINHYSYVMHRAAGRLGPGHPRRQAEWKAEVAQLAASVG